MVLSFKCHINVLTFNTTNNNHFTGNFMDSVPVNEFGKSSIFGEK